MAGSSKPATHMHILITSLWIFEHQVTLQWKNSLIIFPANLLTGTKHPSAFSTNHLTDTDITTTKTTQKPKQPMQENYQHMH